jgi:ABC-type transport system involved in multi-copper enzyme maturation permease subunit
VSNPCRACSRAGRPAPLVAREIEQSTLLVAWTQSVSRRKWHTAKVLTLGAGLAVISLIARWPLQLTFLTIALTLAAVLLASGWHATRTRAI